ncbi:hypothetical protein I6F15_28840 [Bradyrhizobium sp. BRP14]|nr:hypothetical protein [Bradyrhizobium sp. BRP14]
MKWIESVGATLPNGPSKASGQQSCDYSNSSPQTNAIKPSNAQRLTLGVTGAPGGTSTTSMLGIQIIDFTNFT